MARKMKSKAAKKKDKKIVHRVTTFTSDGAVSMEVAPDPAVLDLGPVLLPSPEDAVIVLGILAELNDRTLQAHARFAESQTKTKTLKGKWEELAQELQRKLRTSTHASDLPLFNGAEREADLQELEAAAGAGDARDTGDDWPE